MYRWSRTKVQPSDFIVVFEIRRRALERDTSSLENVGTVTAAKGPELLPFDQLSLRGRSAGDVGRQKLDPRRSAIKASDVATIVYPSGTTGPPRGAQITHANLMATVDMITRVIPLAPLGRSSD